MMPASGFELKYSNYSFMYPVKEFTVTSGYKISRNYIKLLDGCNIKIMSIIIIVIGCKLCITNLNYRSKRKLKTFCRNSHKIFTIDNY